MGDLRTTTIINLLAPESFGPRCAAIYSSPGGRSTNSPHGLARGHLPSGAGRGDTLNQQGQSRRPRQLHPYERPSRTPIQWYTVARTLMREFPSSVEILNVFERNPERTFRLRELVVELGLRSSQARELKHALKDLSRRRKIAYLKKNHFALATRGRDDSAATRARVPHGAQAARGEYERGAS